jgi:hypothetical protein
MVALLVPYCEKMDTKYRKAIPMQVRAACALYKLVHKAYLLIRSEQFAIDKSAISSVLRDVVHTTNTKF